MKRFFLTLSVLALSLVTMTAYAQDKKCGQCNGECAVKRADKIATIFGLDAGTKDQLLELNRGLMKTCAAKPEAADKSAEKAFKKEMKAAKKGYDKSLKTLIGKKNFRKLKAYDKVESNAVKEQQKAAAKAEAKAAKAAK